jgi:hypothetical protein
MTEIAEQELHEFMPVEAPLTWIEKSTLWLISVVSGPGGRRFKSSLPDQLFSIAYNFVNPSN